MRTVQASAKTREDAIQKALDSLGVEMYEVDNIEIIDEGSKGLFGFGSRPVVVQVTIENHPDEHAEPKKPRQERPNRDRREQPQKSARPQKRNEKELDTRGKGSRPEIKPEPQKDNKTGEKAIDSNDSRGRKGRGNRRGDSRDKPAVESNTAPKRNDARVDSRRGGQPAKKSERPQPQETRTSRAATGIDEKIEHSVPAVEPEPIPENAVIEDITVNITDNQGKQAAQLLQDIIGKMGMVSEVEFSRAEDGSARLNVASEDGAILIGRKGRTLNALQYVINRMISLQEDAAENTERLVVDVEGYIDRRRKTLEDMALSFARKAKDTQRNMRLKPLSPQERRIIHLTLQDDEEVRTFSLGDSLYRSIVISPRNVRSGDKNNRDRGPHGNNNRRYPNQEDAEIDAGQFGD